MKKPGNVDVNTSVEDRVAGVIPTTGNLAESSLGTIFRIETTLELPSRLRGKTRGHLYREKPSNNLLSTTEWRLQLPQPPYGNAVLMHP